jgi:hypothetical protein
MGQKPHSNCFEGSSQIEAGIMVLITNSGEESLVWLSVAVGFTCRTRAALADAVCNLWVYTTKTLKTGSLLLSHSHFSPTDSQIL